jgi:hypothetical protein
MANTETEIFDCLGERIKIGDVISMPDSNKGRSTVFESVVVEFKYNKSGGIKEVHFIDVDVWTGEISYASSRDKEWARPETIPRCCYKLNNMLKPGTMEKIKPHLEDVLDQLKIEGIQ